MTAGPCREPIDPVRFISNRSSGKMGYALAEAAVAAQGQVTLISGPTALTPPPGVEFVAVETTNEMFEAVDSRFDRSDILIMAAAPSDFIAVEPAGQKIKKTSNNLTLLLQPAVDILGTVTQRRREDQLIIGFALETENGLENARQKLTAKRLDLILLNNATESGAGFDTDTNRVTLISPNREPELWPLLTKSEISRRLLDYLANMS